MILVVDDDPAILEKAREVLNKTRRVFLASDPDQAFALAEKPGFSVALVDLNLHGRAGFDLIQKLHEKIPGLPIIAIGGQLQGRLLERLRDLGVLEILNKPVTLEWKPVVERIRARRRPPNT